MRRNDPAGTLPLFESPEPEKVRIPASRPKGSGKPRWSKYRPKSPSKCDLCMAVLAETRGQGPIARPARWKRVAGAVNELLCYAHAQLRRDEDGMTALKEGTS